MQIAQIGLTGGIAEGKSTVLGYLQEAGLSTASADEGARAVFARPEIQSRLSSILALSEPIDRREMREKLSRDSGVRRAVNRLMHEPVMQWMREQRADVVEVPLLIEACLMDSFKEIWVVTCGREEQLRRLEERLGNREAARRMISTQIATRAKTAFAARVIRTDQPADHVKNFARLLVSERTAP